LKIDNTATGSVADINTQNIKQTKNGTCIQINGKIKYRDIANNNHDIINQNIANNDIAFIFFSKFLYFILYADSKRSTGRNTKNNNSGVNLKSSIKLKNSIFDIGTNNKPTTTKSTV
jgi:hypothetical protein